MLNALLIIKVRKQKYYTMSSYNCVENFWK